MLDQIRPPAEIEAELLPGEYVQWVGQPSATRSALKNPLLPVFGVLWLVVCFMIFGVAFFSVSATSSATSAVVEQVGGGGGVQTVVVGGSGVSMVPNIFGLFALLFIALGIGMVLSPLWNYLKAGRTTYAITNRRLLMIEGMFGSSVKSFGPQDIDRIERRQYRDGSGDIIIGYEQRTGFYNSSATGMYHRRNYQTPIGMFGIPNVREVETILLETFRPDESYKLKRKNDFTDDGELFFDEDEWEDESGQQSSTY